MCLHVWFGYQIQQGLPDNIKQFNGYLIFIQYAPVTAVHILASIIVTEYIS